MSRAAAVLAGLAVIVAVALLVTGPTIAGPEKVQFPAKWESFVLYTTLDRPDNKQYRELYASSQAAVDAMKAGKPLPQGTVTSGPQIRGPVMTKGQSYSQAFSAPGVYEYICGLHPSMKGQVEVK